MPAKFLKRLSAYIIDIIIFAIIIVLIGNNFINKNNISKLNQQLNNINEQSIKKEISTFQYIKEYSNIIYQIDKEEVLINIVYIIVIIIYFVLFPYFIQGKTIGLYLLKLKIVRNDGELLTLNNLLIRNFIINGLAYLSLSLVIIYIFNGITYFTIASILGIIQLGLVIKSGYMVLYNKDRLGLQDILSQTKIIMD